MILAAPAAEAVQAEALTLPERARSLQILNDADLEAGAEFLRSLKTFQRKVEDTFEPLVTAAHKAHKEAVALKTKALAPALDAERITKGAIGAYYQEQERERARLQREADERARKARDEEAARIAADLERRKNDEEAARDELVDQAARLEAAGRTDEAAELLARADNAESEARVTEAELVDATVAAITEAPAAWVPPPTKVAGVSVKTTWTWELVDVTKLRPEYLLPNKKAIDAAVRTLQDKAQVGEGAIRIFKGAPGVSARGL